MLLVLLAASVVLWMVVFAVLTLAAMRIVRRLGVDPLVLLLWLGLAERPIVPRAQRVRLNESFGAPVAAAARRLEPQSLAGPQAS